MTDLVHATTVAIDGRAVLITGPSGAGKSDLALRLIDRGATLVSDDRTLLARDGDAVVASAPATIAGRIEVRGLGIVARPHAPAPVALVVELAAEVERLPTPRTRELLGVTTPAIRLDPLPASAAVKVEWALRHADAIVA